MKKNLIMLVTIWLAACSSSPRQEAGQTTQAPNTGATVEKARGEKARATTSPNPQLDQFFQDYFMASLELSPLQGTFLGLPGYNHKMVNFLSEDFRQRTHNFNQTWLQRLAEIDRSQLNEQDQISYDLFQYQQQQALAGEQYPSHLIPINQFFSTPSFAARLGSGQSAQPFKTMQDYRDWAQRARGFVVLFGQAISNMREGIERGVVQPRVLMEKTLPQLATHLHDNVQDSVFWGPINNLPDTFTTEEQEQLRNEYGSLIGAEIIPAYRRLHDFIRDEYLPHTRMTVGTSELPDGNAWYDYLIQAQTTTSMTADEIHNFGLREVKRILGEMQAVKRQVGFNGTLAEFFTWLKAADQFYFSTEQELLDGYGALQHKVNQLLPKLFDIAPKADYVVRPIEAFRAQSAAGASYQRGAPDGSRPGVFYVNTYNLRAQPKYGMETLSLHEASPGHHFQISIQQEIAGLPAFRRFGGYSAFSEGWALYAESLGKELGMFSDPYQYFGRLSDEMLRAMRLVVDTGLHAKGWSREQAIQYMTDNSDMAESDVIAEVERYIAIPGQALAYKVGQSIISDLRREAEERLGERFNIKDFHRVVLTGGAMPMDILKRRVRAWIDDQI